MLLLPILALVLAWAAPGPARAQKTGPGDRLLISGTVVNTQGNGVKDAVVHVYLGGQRAKAEEETVAAKDGRFAAELVVPAGFLPEGRVEIEAEKPAHRTSARRPWARSWPTAATGRARPGTWPIRT